MKSLLLLYYNKQNISEAEEEDDDENEDDEDLEKDNKQQKNGIKFRLPQRTQIENKKSQSNLNNQKVLTETTNQLKNISKIENRPSTSNSSSYKPIYTTSIHQSQQMQKKYNYKQKSFNTLPKRSDPVARYQQMSQQWKKTKFLQNTNGMKEGRKLNLDIVDIQEYNIINNKILKLYNTRIEQQKQELKESGMFHRYCSSNNFIYYLITILIILSFILSHIQIYQEYIINLLLILQNEQYIAKSQLFL